jgi:MOSC domain-containing protein YiiM
MHHAIEHVTATELEHGLPIVLKSPRDMGRLEAIVIRPGSNERRSPTSARLSPEGGLDGDRWATDAYYKKANGKPDRRSQVSLMNARFLRQVAGSEEAMSLAGDNLIIDLDLSDANVPAGTRLAVGSEVVIEVNDKSHTGCAKLSRRYGDEAKNFMNHESRKSLRLRGRFGSVVAGGTIQVGDVVRKLPMS